jgi:hypothetical protein
MTNEQIENVWRQYVLPIYNKMERARLYALNADAKRHLAFLWRACHDIDNDNATKLFQWSLTTLADECGINVLQPLPPNELKPPKSECDCFGDRLPNPFAGPKPDLKGQTILMQRNPKLAELYKKAAESPWGAWAQWQDEQAANMKQRAIKYDSDSHAANPFCNGANETEKAAFVRNADAATVERCKVEAVPVTFPTGKGFNLTAQSQISRNLKLNALFNAMMEREREWRDGARAKARADIESAQRSLKELEAAK